LPHAHTVRLQIVAADVSGRAAIDGQAKFENKGPSLKIAELFGK
jgi:hypothetical protein